MSCASFYCVLSIDCIPAKPAKRATILIAHSAQAVGKDEAIPRTREAGDINLTRSVFDARAFGFC